MTRNSKLSQTEKAVLGLRGMIVQGFFQPGDRIIEQTVVDHCFVSRTPARAALQKLCEEGFIERAPTRGYTVSSFTRKDVFDAIAIRGTLEGVAARLAAEKGCSKQQIHRMHLHLQEIDEILLIPDIAKRQEEYSVANDRLHLAVSEAASSPMVTRALERLTTIPFALNNSFTIVPPQLETAVADILHYAQAQHRRLVHAIEHRESARAEALTREHSRSTWDYLSLMLRHSPDEPFSETLASTLITNVDPVVSPL